MTGSSSRLTGNDGRASSAGSPPQMAPYRLSAFNRLSPGQAAAVLLPCLGVPRWADQVQARRPYPTLDHLIAHAGRLARTLTAAELALARDHRRDSALDPVTGVERLIGDRRARNLPTPTPDQLAALGSALITYQSRFHQPFLIRLAGRSTTRVCELISQRCSHDLTDETATLEEELSQIALLALVRRVI